MACKRGSADSMRNASITTSCVADEKPKATAAKAMVVKPVCGSISAIQTMDAITAHCDNNNQPRRRPKKCVKKGKGILSTSGAHTNLNEYPKAAQLK